MKKDLSSAAAAVIRSLPGFTLPLVAALVLSPRSSDVLLLAVSVAVTQAVIVSSAVDSPRSPSTAGCSAATPNPVAPRCGPSDGASCGSRCC
jgi:hypothetical protein